MTVKIDTAAQPHALRGVHIDRFGGTARRQTGIAARPAGRCIAQVQVPPDVCEREPAHLDQPEETLGAEHAVILVQVAHVSVGDDEARQGVEDFGRLARARTQSRALWYPVARRLYMRSSDDCLV